MLRQLLPSQKEGGSCFLGCKPGLVFLDPFIGCNGVRIACGQRFSSDLGWMLVSKSFLQPLVVVEINVIGYNLAQGSSICEIPGIVHLGFYTSPKALA